MSFLRGHSGSRSLQLLSAATARAHFGRGFSSACTFKYEIVYWSRKPGSRARVGRITTAHGTIETPGFVGVGTNGTIKCLTTEYAHATGLQAMFCNTYHLILHPGPAVVSASGGIHAFTGWQRPVMTDSGGFQVFSLSHSGGSDEMKGKSVKERPNTVLKVKEEGVSFRSYRDGTLVLLTPESSVAAQKQIGADIIVPLDELLPNVTDPERLAESLERTHRWERRSLAAHLSDPRGQAMYCVLHGGTDRRLREKSVRELCALPFDGIAIGGSVGRDRHEMAEVLGYLMPLMDAVAEERAGGQGPFSTTGAGETGETHTEGSPLSPIAERRPVHLLGIGDPSSVFLAVPHGIDTFDSSYPTKAARHGTILLSDGRHRKLTSEMYTAPGVPLEPGCTCLACRPVVAGGGCAPLSSEEALAMHAAGAHPTHASVYVRHLMKAAETTAHMLLTSHNVTAINRMFANIRSRIMRDEI